RPNTTAERPDGMPKTLIRPARPEDAGTIVDLVKALAIYEKEPLSSVKITPADVRRDGFGAERRFEALIAELDAEPVGFALFFHNYSTRLNSSHVKISYAVFCLKKKI